MRQIDDAQIDAKLAGFEKTFNDLTAEIKQLEMRLNSLKEEQLRIQGEYRAWASFKGDKAEKAPAETEN